MKHTYTLLLALLCHVHAAFGQKWISQSFSIQTTADVAYGKAVDFAGNERSLLMDITVPTDDAPPSCGRPLMVVVHGGGFLGGSKGDAGVRRMMKEFAQRGYVTASVDYRLGMFQTPNEVHCNVTQLFNFPWDCLNMADTAEWYRGAYRAMQDARGATRYLINHRDEYNIDPDNVFLVGESAGAFTVLMMGYLDDPGEKPIQASALPNALPPNKIYEQTCIQKAQWDTTIASMKLARPDLGPIEGTLNLPSRPHTIRAVGAFYGAVFGDLLAVNASPSLPALYMYHQPNDLVVPFNQGRVFQGISNCLQGFPGFCSSIINRPWVYGSKAIKTHVEALKSAGKPAPDYLFDQTSNQTDCAGQIANTSLTGHAIDNFAIRTFSMAYFFAPRVKSCTSASHEVPALPFLISPNPVQERLTVVYSGADNLLSASLTDLTGRVVLQQTAFAAGPQTWDWEMP
ncbi:MAG TPA: carboxylesterase family protein, partial [Saprospiraceae bacterium]|nr:carboxylesterase family protein [Saprospiraceae bacterium]